MRVPSFNPALAFLVNSRTARTELLSSAQGRSSKPADTLIPKDHGVSQCGDPAAIGINPTARWAARLGGSSSLRARVAPTSAPPASFWRGDPGWERDRLPGPAQMGVVAIARHAAVTFCAYFKASGVSGALLLQLRSPLPAPPVR